MVALDVAGALGMLHDQAAAAMLLAKYSLDGNATRAYRDHWRTMVDRQGYREGWESGEVSAARAELLADYSLTEWLDAQRCRTCRGVGAQTGQTGRVLVCSACDGTGNRKIGLRAPARALGMSAEGFRRSPWSGRMEWARRELQRREQAALGALAWRLTKSQ
jgi:hypothetical protein